MVRQILQLLPRFVNGCLETNTSPLSSVSSTDSRQKRQELTSRIRHDAREQMLTRVRRVETTTQESTSRTEASAKMAMAIYNIPKYVEDLRSGDLAVVRDAALHIRDLMSIDESPPTNELIQAGAVPALVDALKLGDENIQLEAAWSLTNIASGRSEHTASVVAAGAIPIFVELMRSSSVTVREQAVWALGNIAGDSAAFRDEIISTGAIDTLLGICHERGKIGMLRNATWTLSNFCRGTPAPDFAVVSRALPTLQCMVNFNDNDIIADACWALTYLSDSNTIGNEELAQFQIQAIIEAGVVPKLVEHLDNPSVYVVTPALRALGNLATGTDLQTDILLQARILSPLLKLLHSPRRGLRKESCWTISNITAGPVNQINAVLKADIFPTLIEIMRSQDYDVRKEATWAVTNAIASRYEVVIRYLVDYSVIVPLTEMLDAGVPEPRVLSSILEAIRLILIIGASDAKAAGKETNVYADFLEGCGGVEKVSDLQQHTDPSVANAAYDIIATFFLGDSDDADATAPEINDEGTFSFGTGAGSPGSQNDFQF